jgi:hypothetical protein
MLPRPLQYSNGTKEIFTRPRFHAYDTSMRKYAQWLPISSPLQIPEQSVESASLRPSRSDWVITQTVCGQQSLMMIMIMQQHISG